MSQSDTQTAYTTALQSTKKIKTPATATSAEDNEQVYKIIEKTI